MQIIQATPNANGGRPPIQSWSGATLPTGYAEVNCDTSAFYEYCGFVDIVVVEGVCTAIVGNQTAYDAYIASLPEPTEPEPTADEQLRADVDFLLVMGGY